jgi:hypothetical protein
MEIKVFFIVTWKAGLGTNLNLTDLFYIFDMFCKFSFNISSLITEIFFYIAHLTNLISSASHTFCLLQLPSQIFNNHWIKVKILKFLFLEISPFPS